MKERDRCRCDGYWRFASARTGGEFRSCGGATPRPPAVGRIGRGAPGGNLPDETSRAAAPAGGKPRYGVFGPARNLAAETPATADRHSPRPPLAAVDA